jgi:hypothetical protein
MLEQIAQVGPFEKAVQVIYSPTIASLYSYFTIDLKVLATDGRAVELIDDLYEEFEYPLTVNKVTEKHIEDITKGFDVQPLIGLFAELPITELPVPYQRKFGDPLSIGDLRRANRMVEEMFPVVLPFAANKISDSGAAAVVAELGDLMPLDIYVNNVQPFEEWISRHEEVDPTEELIDRLFELVLQQDILPYLPLDIDPEIELSILSATILGLLNDGVVFDCITQCSAESLISHERREKMNLVTPETVIWDALWIEETGVLHHMPLVESTGWSSKNRMRIYEIIVNEYGNYVDHGSDDLSSDDESSDYHITDKQSGFGTKVWLSGDESDALFSISELTEEEEDSEVL